MILILSLPVILDTIQKLTKELGVCYTAQVNPLLHRLISVLQKNPKKPKQQKQQKKPKQNKNEHPKH